MVTSSNKQFFHPKEEELLCVDDIRNDMYPLSWTGRRVFSCAIVRNPKIIAMKLGYSSAEYRKMLSALRARIKIIENNLREDLKKKVN